jgi:hypothetical protein
LKKPSDHKKLAFVTSPTLKPFVMPQFVGGLFSLKVKNIAAPILLIDSPKILFGKGFISDKYH